MNTQINLPLAILCLVLLVASLAVTGCASRPAGPGDEPLIQRALERSLPRSHTGHAAFAFRGQYLTIEGEADGLSRNEAGAWTFTWLTYRRTLTVPWFAGLHYSHVSEFTLGSKP